MQTRQIDLIPFSPEHLDAAVGLSRQAGWPHRPEDWQMALALSKGVVAVEGDRTVGTVLVTSYKEDCATINMVIVDETMRGRGLGRRLMDAAVHIAGNRPLRLVATEEGLPLYEKFGFQETGRVLQHQGVVGRIAAPAGVEPANPADVAAIAELDRSAFGGNRANLIANIATIGEFAVIRRDGRVCGYAAARPFGRGEVIGPVVAADLEDAKALITYLIARRPGQFLRVDAIAETGLGPWLAERGLAHVGGGIVMMTSVSERAADVTATTFALAAQAFG